ncbi:MAG: hypothetical protein EOO11_17650 [Chitinophagaceae bacterium]|nr:MAG: hypothetical protein EOO11_17650 [Chitinophagaceae bacterium]
MLLPASLRKTALLFALLCGLVLLLAQCIGGAAATPPDPRGAAFAGSAACRSCHAAQSDSHQGTAHYHSTDSAHTGTVAGFTAESGNRFRYNDSTWVQTERRDSGLFQVAYVHGKEVATARGDIVFGNRHAQTFLHWRGARTYELPLSYYYGAGRWGTSPGFSATHPRFDRFIGRSCFECHSSWIGSRPVSSPTGIEEALDRGSIIYGIDCERCHGPAAQHVAFHAANPKSKEGRHIARFAALTRDQKLDVCAVCHSGSKKMQERSTFYFRPGDTLANYYLLWREQSERSAESAGGFDVHGNQFGLLTESACFRNTKTLDCSSCHKPHSDASRDLRGYSQVCSSCHRAVQHDFDNRPEQVTAAKNNCIDCHMPLGASSAITFQLSDSAGPSAYRLRTHRIGIYPQGSAPAKQ